MAAVTPDYRFSRMLGIDMGGKEGLLEPHDSVAGILKVITSATVADSGKYLRYNGEEIPW